jgi:muconolactone delta-isomerase
MQFINVSRRVEEKFSNADFEPLAAAEAEEARALYTEGFIRQIWHRADIAGACMLLEADSIEQAREKLQRLPLVRLGMLETNVIPIKPYAGFKPRGPS